MSDDRDQSLRQRAAAQRAWRDRDVEDNPFLEVVEELREDGMSFSEIADLAHELESSVGDAAMAEKSKLIPEWKVTVKVPDADTPSGYRYEYYERSGTDRDEVEDRVIAHTGCKVVSEKTEQIGYVKVL